MTQFTYNFNYGVQNVSATSEVGANVPDAPELPMVDGRPDFTGIHLWERLLWANSNLERFETEIVVVADPDSDDQPARILVPAPEWMAAAMYGGIIPPVEHYHNEPRDEKGNFIGPKGYWRNYEALGPLTEEQAIEYLIKKDLPRHIWEAGYRPGANRLPFAVCKREDVPQDRTYRDAWRLN